MRTERRRFGDKGEDLAADFLRARGFRIIARQVRIGRLGEIDLVCADPTSPKGLRGASGEIVFVEVKTRRDRTFGPPEEAVTPSKLGKLRRAVEAWLAGRGLADAPHRIDVVAVDLTGERPVIRHLEGVGQ